MSHALLLNTIWFAGAILMLVGARMLPSAAGYSTLSLSLSLLGITLWKSPVIAVGVSLFSGSAPHQVARAFFVAAVILGLAGVLQGWRQTVLQPSRKDQARARPPRLRRPW